MKSNKGLKYYIWLNRFNIVMLFKDKATKREINKLKKRHHDAKKPEYDRKMKVWVVRVDNRFEFGSLNYVVSEYCKSGLYYPYNDMYTADKTWNNHAHSFEGVLEAVVNSPDTFSIDGFENCYSKQEIELIETLRCELCKK